jgi:hypothetical protein
VIVPDPVAAGFVDSLARPGGNATGFINFEYSISPKWLELLKQISPSVTRVAVLRDPALAQRESQYFAPKFIEPGGLPRQEDRPSLDACRLFTHSYDFVAFGRDGDGVDTVAIKVLAGSWPKAKAGSATETQIDFRLRGGTVIMSRRMSPRRTFETASAMASMCQLSKS